MKILKIIEQKDGSALMDCEFTQSEINTLIGYAVVDILKKEIIKISNKRKEKDE